QLFVILFQGMIYGATSLYVVQKRAAPRLYAFQKRYAPKPVLLAIIAIAEIWQAGQTGPALLQYIMKENDTQVERDLARTWVREEVQQSNDIKGQALAAVDGMAAKREGTLRQRTIYRKPWNDVPKLSKLPDTLDEAEIFINSLRADGERAYLGMP